MDARNLVILPPALLAIDVGNSRIKYGWFEPADHPTGMNAGPWPVCRHFAAGPLTCPAPWDQIRTWTDPLRCEVVLAGSNPAVVEQMATHWQGTTGRAPFVIRDRRALPLNVAVTHPDKVGLDRLLNAVAAGRLKAAAEGALVIDSGTATTVDAILPDGSFAGGAILPGLALSSKALHHYTALLPELTLAELGPETPPPLGTETRGALRSGIYWGQVGAIRELVRQLGRELRWRLPPAEVGDLTDGVPCRAFLTGGGAPWLAAQFPEWTTIPSLAMHGLVLTAWSQPQHTGCP